MIRVTVELVSAIDPSRDKVLGVARIANLGIVAKTDAIHYIYDVQLSKWAPKESQTWKRGRLELTDLGELGIETLHAEVGPFDRQKRGAWDLLYLALKAVVGDRNP